MHHLSWVCLVALAGCATKAASGPLVPAMPSVDAGCRLGASANSVLVTEWAEFAALDLKRLADSMATKVLLDGRRLYGPAKARAAGFTYLRVGSKA